MTPREDDRALLEDWRGGDSEAGRLFEVPQPTIARRLQRARARPREAVERLVADPALRDASVQGRESCGVW